MVVSFRIGPRRDEIAGERGPICNQATGLPRGPAEHEHASLRARGRRALL